MQVINNPKPKKLIIYYFSGTGNAKNVSNWIANISRNYDYDVELADISKLENRKKIELHNDALMGICSPTHGFNFPPIMFHFILRFPKSKNNKLFIVNTRAGMKMGNYFLPGLSGMAQYFSALILKLKGFNIIGMHPIDLPSNWISFHPGIKPKVVESIYNKRKRETERFAQKICKGEKDLKAMKDIVQDVIISPIAVLYYIIGRFVLAKSFYASKDCTKCDLCIKKCPVQAIKTIDNRPYWSYRCESCMQCMNICPERAIETAHGFVFGAWVLINSVVLYHIYKAIPIYDFLNSFLSNWVSKLILFFFDAFLIVGFFILFYWIFHYLLRFRFFERLVVYTSLTKWKFWRRYKAPRI
jgi:ferredoxin/flavodoxin